MPPPAARDITTRVFAGVVVPIPTLPAVVAKYAEPVALIAVVLAYGKNEARVVEVAR